MFELEKSIKQWRKELFKNEALEDGFIEELENHLRDEISALQEQGISDLDAFTQAVKKIGPVNQLGSEFYKTTRRGLSGTPPGKPTRLLPALFWNYLKITLRKIKRQKGYSFINIAGLSVGIACCVFILLFVTFELSFDRFHKNSDRIYIVGQANKSEKGLSKTVGNFPLMAPTLKDRFSQVEAAGRYNEGWITQVSYQDKVFKEQGLWDADPGVFQVLTIPFVKGDPKTALSQPYTAVITEKYALKYFGDADPLGKLLMIGDKEYEITGITKNPPENTIFYHKIIKSWKTVENEEHWSGWSPGMAATMCLVKLRAGADPMEFEKQISGLPHEYCGEELEKMGTTLTNFTLPMTELHLVTFKGGEKKASSSLIYVYIFSAVGILILLIACMNYMNLATARSATRAAEVGMRKVVGAHKKQLVRQFLGESMLLAFLALLFAGGIVSIFLPMFNQLTQMSLTSQDVLQPKIILGMLILWLVTGLGAGTYPALVLSAFRPIAILRGKFLTGRRGKKMRRVLVLGQFTISIALVISTLFIFQQILFMKKQPLGFDKEQKLVISLRDWRMITENYTAVKEEFLQHSNILNITAASGVPGSMINRTYVFPFGEQEAKGAAFRSLRCDHDFIKVYGVKLVAGRFFNPALKTDTYQAFVINESGVKAFGWASPEEALGKKLWDDAIPIIGVVKDFHWWGLQRDIEPLIMRVVPDLFRSITLTVNTSNLDGTLEFLQAKFNRLFPGDVFEYFFVDSNFNLQYRSEERTGRIFRIFTFLGIFIACLGLLGLASFITEQRTKEIGIRKILGARTATIFTLLSREFVLWILAANILAWPIAYFAVHKWLQGFAYRTQLSFWLFLMAAVITLGIALATVAYQALRAANTDPVNSLRYE